jgi:hypothetical protein
MDTLLPVNTFYAITMHAGIVADGAERPDAKYLHTVSSAMDEKFKPAK